jgi:hypothetical protein
VSFFAHTETHRRSVLADTTAEEEALIDSSVTVCHLLQRRHGSLFLFLSSFSRDVISLRLLQLLHTLSLFH